MSSVVSVKLEKDKVRVLEEIASEKNMDRCAVVRKLLDFKVR